MSWIDMRARKPTEQDALMEAGGDLAVEVLCRHEHGYYPMIVTLKQIAEAEERAGKYYPFWRAIPPMPGSLVPWNVYYRYGGDRPG